MKELWKPDDKTMPLFHKEEQEKQKDGKKRKEHQEGKWYRTMKRDRGGKKKREEKIKGRKGKMGASGARCRRSGGLEAASRCIASGPIVGPHNTVMI